MIELPPSSVIAAVPSSANSEALATSSVDAPFLISVLRVEDVASPSFLKLIVFARDFTRSSSSCFLTSLVTGFFSTFLAAAAAAFASLAAFSSAALASFSASLAAFASASAFALASFSASLAAFASASAFALASF
jgi:hypothetical protein